MARPKVDDPREVTLSVKVSETDAAAIDKVRGTRSRSRWLHRVILEELVANDASRREARPAARQDAGCPHRLPPGAYCRSCDQITPERRTSPKGERQ